MHIGLQQQHTLKASPVNNYNNATATTRIQPELNSIDKEFWQKHLGASCPAIATVPSDYSKQSEHGGQALGRTELANSRLLLTSHWEYLQCDTSKPISAISLVEDIETAIVILVHRMTTQSELVFATAAPNTPSTLKDSQVLVRIDVQGDAPSFANVKTALKERKVACLMRQSAAASPEHVIKALYGEEAIVPTHVGFYSVATEVKTALAVVEALPMVFDLNFVIALSAADKHDKIALNLVYNKDMFTKERADEILSQVQEILIQANKVKSIHDISLVTKHAKTVLPSVSQVIDEAWPSGSILARFEANSKVCCCFFFCLFVKTIK